MLQSLPWVILGSNMCDSRTIGFEEGPFFFLRINITSYAEYQQNVLCLKEEGRQEFILIKTRN